MLSDMHLPINCNLSDTLETVHGDNKNCDWSFWAADVFSFKFVMLVEIVSEDHMKQVGKRLLSCPFQ